MAATNCVDNNDVMIYERRRRMLSTPDIATKASGSCIGRYTDLCVVMFIAPQLFSILSTNLQSSLFHCSSPFPKLPFHLLSSTGIIHDSYFFTYISKFNTNRTRSGSEGTVEGGSVGLRPYYMETYVIVHRPDINVGIR